MEFWLQTVEGRGFSKNHPKLVGLEELRQQMTITKERKRELVGQFKRNDNDTGSAEVQIAILTTRINGLTEHLRTHKKDFAGRRGLLMLVSRRRRLLDYLKRVEPQRYLEVIRRLEIRK